MRTPFSSAAAPLCDRRRRPRRTTLAFVETTESHITRSLPSLSLPNDHRLSERSAEPPPSSSSIAHMVVSSLPRADFLPAGPTRTMNQLLSELPSAQDVANDEPQQQQSVVALDVNDKMGLFLSVCSVLVSVQMFLPKGL